MSGRICELWYVRYTPHSPCDIDKSHIYAAYATKAVVAVMAGIDCQVPFFTVESLRIFI